MERVAEGRGRVRMGVEGGQLTLEGRGVGRENGRVWQCMAHKPSLAIVR